MQRGGEQSQVDWDAQAHRVLFLRHDRIGDMILSTGLLRVIARSHHTIRLDVLASPANAPVLGDDPHVDSLVIFDRARPWRYLAAVRRLRSARYDAVIDCMPTAPSLTTLLLILASGARHRIGVAGRGNDAAFTLLVQPVHGATHVVDRLGALAAAFGVDPRTVSFQPRLYLAEDERARACEAWTDDARVEGRRRLLVNVSAGRAFRRWPDDRYVAAIRHAMSVDPGLCVRVIASPDDVQRAAAIAGEAQVRFAPTPKLREALALVATADLVFTPDTGLAHAAAAFERPAVVMYVHGTEAGWGLYGSNGYHVSSPDGSLDSLRLEPVLEVLDGLLAGGGAGGARPVAPRGFGQFVPSPTNGRCATVPGPEGRAR